MPCQTRARQARHSVIAGLPAIDKKEECPMHQVNLLFCLAATLLGQQGPINLNFQENGAGDAKKLVYRHRLFHRHIRRLSQTKVTLRRASL